MYAHSHGCSCGGNSLVRDEKKPAAGIFVKRVTLTNFRNYAYLRLDLPECPVILTGKNGAGKTNLMEAVSFLAPGKGIRNTRFSEVTLKPENEKISSFPWAVAATLQNGTEEIDIGTGCEVSADGRFKTEKRGIRINGDARKSQSDLGSVCSAVWLTPAMDRLFSADPAGRRRFWDRLTQAFYPGHAGHCAAYSQALRQWGVLLREGRTNESWLAALEETLGRYAEKVASARRGTLAKLADRLETSLSAFPRALVSLCGGAEEILAGMDTAEAACFIRGQFRISRKTYLEGGTTAGIHTVDLQTIHREKQMPAAMCSTGEQKALLISILLAHVRAQAEQTGTLPLLLLDEVSAHLDAERRRKLFDELCSLGTQVWMTGTEKSLFEEMKETAHFVAVDELAKTQPVLAAVS